MTCHSFPCNVTSIYASPTRDFGPLLFDFVRYTRPPKQKKVYYDKETAPLIPSVAFKWDRDNNKGNQFHITHEGTILTRHTIIGATTSTFSSKTPFRDG